MKFSKFRRYEGVEQFILTSQKFGGEINPRGGQMPPSRQPWKLSVRLLEGL